MTGIRGLLPVLRSGLASLAVLLVLYSPLGRAMDGDPWKPFDMPWFTQVGISQGLPHSITTAVAQDRSGLMWIGTMGGLVRYDGYRLQIFEAGEPGKPGLPDAYVRSLLALPDGSLLIGTNAGGLARFDPSDNRIHAYKIGAGGLSDSKVYSLSDNHAGGVWIATENGLNHLDLATDKLTQVDTGAGPAARNFSVMQDRAGNLWLGNNDGLFLRHAGSTSFVRQTSPDKAGIVLADQIWALQEDSEGRIWAGSVQAGAAYRDTAGHWHGVPGFSGYSDGLHHDTVRAFLQTDDGVTWIATDGGGLIEYQPGDAAIRQVKHDSAVPSSLPGDSVRGLLQDRSGNMWAATDLGVARTDPNARTAFSLLPSPLERHALADSNVNSIYVDSRQRIWLGLGAGHIDMIDLKAGDMHHLHLTGAQSQRNVRSITEAADGSLWVGSQGLAWIDPDSLAISDVALPAFDNKPVLTMAMDGNQIIIGTYDGLYRYDPATRALDHASHVASDPQSLASDTVQQIAHIGDQWWYGTTAGISVANGEPLPPKFENLRHRADDPGSLPQEYVGSITRDARSRIWVSTFGGLAELEQHAAGTPYRFRTIGLAQGLSSDKVNATLFDDHDQIWASLSNGIARIDADSLAVHNIGTRDGLHVASYVSVAAARAPGGELLFGGLGGLTVIRPDWTPPAMPPLHLAVTQVVVGGMTLPFGRLPHDGEAISLDQRNHTLRMDFALLDFQAPMETSYSYRMEGLDEEWNLIPKGGLPSAIYTNLPYGDYRLRLRAETHGMHPHRVENSIGIDVKPLWHETLISRLAAILLLVGLIALLVHLRTIYLRRQAAQLQQQINEHTRDLLAANQRLDELASTDGLTGVYNRRRFLELVRAEHERSHERSLCIALFDLDRFKLINDTHGHLAGDAVIRAAIDVIKQHCRQADLIGRYGGEEFVLCLPDTSLQHARETSQRICTALAETTVQYDGQLIPVTVSVGVATLQRGESIEQWLSRADKALYEAKRLGRNRCVAAG
ncbi:MAG: diguanylate cyclase [Rhodanobacter sp.]